VIKALAAIQEEKGHAAGTLAAVEASLNRKVAPANLEKTVLPGRRLTFERQRARSALEIAEKKRSPWKTNGLAWQMSRTGCFRPSVTMGRPSVWAMSFLRIWMPSW
jgi:hypothetical protein